ncbi:YfiT family bacillithiol transferase [Paraflavitalea pollutisoli]|uniref:YfiT family bacillithiol transferase n=1 Tax=Paraflavitalea pollutisoli TaxID=3034143 RepID=UPI0023EB877F|nr:putative metal-dependent hydrolase [Paraflavitalea sp. H1-2-19X]
MDLRYPIGQYEPQPFSDRQKREWLQDIQFLPGLIEQAIENLDEKQLETPYRDGGWTIKQVVHHVPDSHMNAYARFKLGLTEDNPTIKPYDEVKWAELRDVEVVPINISITLLYALHTRWHAAIRDISNEAWKRTVYHPGSQKEMSLWYLLGSYAWHGKHHVAHITSLRERKRW